MWKKFLLITLIIVAGGIFTIRTMTVTTDKQIEKKLTGEIVYTGGVTIWTIKFPEGKITPIISTEPFPTERINYFIPNWIFSPCFMKDKNKILVMGTDWKAKTKNGKYKMKPYPYRDGIGIINIKKKTIHLLKLLREDKTGYRRVSISPDYKFISVTSDSPSPIMLQNPSLPWGENSPAIPQGKTGWLSLDNIFQINWGYLYISKFNKIKLKKLIKLKVLGWGGGASWSPDSKEIVVTIVNPKKISWKHVAPGLNIYIVNIKTGKLRFLTNGIDPSWSPDGKEIVYVNKDGYFYMINPDGKNNKKLFLPPYTPSQEVAWSPDSKWFLYDDGFYGRLLVYNIKLHQHYLLPSDDLDLYGGYYSWGK